MDPALEAARLVDTLGPETLAKAAAYTAGANRLEVAGPLVAALVTLIVVRWRGLERLQARIGPARPARTALLVSTVALLAIGLLSLPWTIYTDYRRETTYGRTSQPFADWLSQGAIGMVLSTLIGALFFLGLYLLIRKAGRRWWLWSGAMAAAGLTVILLLSPVLIEPIFNNYQPLPPGPVRAALEVQAQAAGVPRDRIFVFDGSRQSNNFTANVSGVMGSARIAISDVALKGASLDEVRAVTGHEIGHYVLNHVWRSVALTALLAIFVFWAADRLFAPAARLFGFGGAIADPAGLPIILFIATVLVFLVQPLTNTLSRAAESEADDYSFRTVNLPDALATALVKTAEYRDPRPSALQEWFFYTHPAVEKRVSAAVRWKAAHPAAAASPAA